MSAQHLDPHLGRQLSPISFETHNPMGCYWWLRSLGYEPLPSRSQREIGRLTKDGAVAVVYRANLLLLTPPRVDQTVCEGAYG